MFVRAYLRASTDDQDANRARACLEAFAQQHGATIAAAYVENASGARSDRPELRRLLNDAHAGDVLLVESVDRLSRLPQRAWKALHGEIESKGLPVVAVDLPTSHTALQTSNSDEFTARILDAVNQMMLEMMAAFARKDYGQRRQRQREGIEKAKQRGAYNGRPPDREKRRRIAELLKAGLSVRKVAELAPASTKTVRSVKEQGVERAGP